MTWNHLTFGIEEEFLLVDDAQHTPMPVSVDALPPSKNMPFNVTPEAHMGVVEIASPIIEHPSEVFKHLNISRGWLDAASKDLGASVMAGGTHHFCDWHNLSMIDLPAYQEVTDEYQDLMRGLFLFGMHMHVGGLEEDLMTRLFNRMRQYIPLCISASANSSHWRGRCTGMASYRMARFGSMPRSGLPPEYPSFQSAMDEIDLLMETGSIKKPTSVWTDIRFHPIYKTIEIRVMDMQTRTEDAEALSMWLLCLVNYLLLCESGEIKDPLSGLPNVLLAENRWRSIRSGLNADIMMTNGDSKSALSLCHDITCHADRGLLPEQGRGSLPHVFGFLEQQHLRQLNPLTEVSIMPPVTQIM